MGLKLLSELHILQQTQCIFWTLKLTSYIHFHSNTRGHLYAKNNTNPSLMKCAKIQGVLVGMCQTSGECSLS